MYSFVVVVVVVDKPLLSSLEGDQQGSFTETDF